MTGRHTSLDDIHGLIELAHNLKILGLVCASLVMVALIAMVLLRITTAL